MAVNVTSSVCATVVDGETVMLTDTSCGGGGGAVNVIV